MRKCLCVFYFLLTAMVFSGEIKSYEDLVLHISGALNEKTKFQRPSFTNELAAFADSATNVEFRVTAKLGMALALHEIAETTADADSFNLGFGLISNVLNASNCPMNAWQRYAAMSISCDYLNAVGKYSDSFNVSTNALDLVERFAPKLETPNFWSPPMFYDGVPGASVKQSFQVNAAAMSVLLGNKEAVHVFTNGLPSSLVRPLLELINDVK